MKELSFSQRQGIVDVQIPYQLDYISEELRNYLWNIIFIWLVEPLKVEKRKSYGSDEESFRLLFKGTWIFYFHKPLDDFPSDYDIFDYIKKYVQSEEWYLVFELFEYMLKQIKDDSRYEYDDIVKNINNSLEKWNSGYRFAEGVFLPVTNEEELDEIRNVGRSSELYGLSGINTHLQASLNFLSTKPVAELRNSIKESISMVEAIARIIEPSETTLGKALKKLESNSRINPTLKDAFEKLYAYTNSRDGIRHALLSENSIAEEDARFFLIACSAFTNYLFAKAEKAGIL